MIPKAPLRFGVLGLGLMGKRHSALISQLSAAVLNGVCDRDAQVTSELAHKFSVQPFENALDLINSPEIDVVVICLPSSLHADFGILAARAGKHIIVEKPIDSQSRKAKLLIDECETANVSCFVINQNRYSPGLAVLKLAISQGLMGSALLARATVKWYRHDEYYTSSNWRGRIEGEHGGVLMNQAIHSIDTLQWLFGVPDEISAYCSNSRPTVVEAEDTAVAIMKWQSGLLASVEASTSSAPGFDEAYEVQSATASVRVDKGMLTHWYHAEGKAAPQVELHPCPSDFDPKQCMFFRQYADIIASLESGVRNITPARHAIEVVETVERMYQSADNAIRSKIPNQDAESSL